MAKIRTLAVLAVGGALAVAASGCAAPGQGAKDTLTYWSMWKEGEAQQKVIADAIADFEAETGITVDVQWQGRNNVTKVVPTLNTNNVPDLVDGSFAKLAPVLAETGQAKALTEGYAADVDATPVTELIPDTYLDAGDLTADGADAPWMLPYSLTSDAVWFDASSHPGLVEDPPTTWDEFVDTLDRLKAAGETPIAIDGDVAGYNAYWYVAAIVQLAGAGALQEIAADPTGEAWNAPEALRAAELVEQLVDGDYFVDGYDASKWPAQQQKWADRGAALLFNGTWIPTETATYAADGFEYSSFPFPGIGDGKVTRRADFIGFAVPRKAQNADAAQQLAAHLLRKEYQDALGSEAAILPVRADATVSPEMSTVKAALEGADAYYQQNDGISFPGYTEKLLWPAIDRLVLGQVTAEEFIESMRTGQAEYWERNS